MAAGWQCEGLHIRGDVIRAEPEECPTCSRKQELFQGESGSAFTYLPVGHPRCHASSPSGPLNSVGHPCLVPLRPGIGRCKLQYYTFFRVYIGVFCMVYSKFVCIAHMVRLHCDTCCYHSGTAVAPVPEWHKMHRGVAYKAQQCKHSYDCSQLRPCLCLVWSCSQLKPQFCRSGTPNELDSPLPCQSSCVQL